MVSIARHLPAKTILFATDFLESSRLALDYAVAFAGHYDARLLIVHVLHIDQPAAEVEALREGPSISRRHSEMRLEAFTAGVRNAGVNAEWRLVEGWVPEALLVQVRELKPDLFVLGTHGVYRGLAHMLIGSNAEEMLLMSPCPTLTVGRHVPGGIGPDFTPEYVFYVTDFTPESAAAAPYAVRLAEDFHARLQICHFLPGGAHANKHEQHKLAETYCDAIRRMMPGAASSWCTPGDQLEHGASKEEILRRVSADGAGLIVMGVQGESQLARHLHISLAYELVATAACPVFTMRG